MAFRRALCSALAPPGRHWVWSSALPLAASADDTVAFTIRDPRITESSGLARDPGRGRLLDRQRLRGHAGSRTGSVPDGKVTGHAGVPGAPVDVEAVAMHEGRLYVADIGDNAAGPGHGHRLLLRRRLGPTTRPSAYRSWDFRYPDGAHDAETLLVNDDGPALSSSPRAPRAAVYAAPRRRSGPASTSSTRVGDAPSAVTDGTFLPGGNRIALLTYGTIEILDAETYQKLGTAAVPAQRQPESITVSLNGKSLLVGSEGRWSRVYSDPDPDQGSRRPQPTPASRAALPPQSREPSDVLTDAEPSVRPEPGRRA